MLKELRVAKQQEQADRLLLPVQSRQALEQLDRIKEDEAQLRALAAVAKGLADGVMIEHSISRMRHTAKAQSRMLIQSL